MLVNALCSFSAALLIEVRAEDFSADTSGCLHLFVCDRNCLSQLHGFAGLTCAFATAFAVTFCPCALFVFRHLFVVWLLLPLVLRT